MNHASSKPAPGLYPDHMVSELLSLHEEMIAQLLLERVGVVGTADFLTGLIGQHEKTAAMLRALLSNHGVDADHNGVPFPAHDPRSGAGPEMLFVPGFRGRIPAVNRLTPQG
jgi:hypothetical protein